VGDRFALCADQVFPPDHRNGKPLDTNHHSALPCLVEPNATDAGEDIDSVGCDSDLKRQIVRNEIRGLQLMEGSSKVFDGSPYPSRVLRCRADPYVRVTGGARARMDRDGVRADDEELSAFLEQCGQHVDEVGVHPPSP
jgi:hypothetical protein